ncbi:flagellar biosynthetic protein FliO [Ideonella sp. YS5]|uniref:flagellar biosynthetic protein FliO n=1 Tax=Ideonella sp. YS5 TaxID=3453714 RepID=UPI003EEAF73F
MNSSTFTPLLAFIGVVALIPLALWLMRRSGYAGAGQDGLMRTVSSLSLSPSQRVVVVEMGQGATARWLVLGVTNENINLLTQMDAPAEVPPGLRAPQAQTVNQLIAKWRSGHGPSRGSGSHE